ncbi:MAG: response regulator [Lachnospiraceae bacterium]|nr:response regulator [Lachnospiraceae bacterium]
MRRISVYSLLIGLSLILIQLTGVIRVSAADTDQNEGSVKTGGAYAVTGQIEGAGYACVLYDEDNALPTSDANCVLCGSDSRIYIGGYSGVIRYDGMDFTRLDSSKGLSNANVMLEDEKGRLWVGTNDYGVLVLDAGDITYFTYKEGLPSSSVKAMVMDGDENVYIGLTDGLCYVDPQMNLHQVEDERLSGEYVNRLSAGPDGTVYGCSRSGLVFAIKNGEIKAAYREELIGLGRVTCVYADPVNAGYVYIGTENSGILHGQIMPSLFISTSINVSPLTDVQHMEYAADRVWVINDDKAGYLDENGSFHVVEDIPFGGICDMAEDYQGNLWLASSRQGVMKIVTGNFKNVSKAAGLKDEVVNTTCLWNGCLYIGTDRGLQIIDEEERVFDVDKIPEDPAEDEPLPGPMFSVNKKLAEHYRDVRIRCITQDEKGRLWIAAYTGGLGLECVDESGNITSYNEKNGFLNNSVRCCMAGEDGMILAGTNGGLAVLKNDKQVRTVSENEGMENTVILTLAQDKDGRIYAGTDGEGIYVIDDDEVSHLGRDDGLSSDVILRIKRDDEHGVFWIITSNSIEYLKDGRITLVESFPYSNNFDIYSGKDDMLWILSSYGLYCIDAGSMLRDEIDEYRCYNKKSGLSSVPIANSYSALDDEGNLYIAGRTGVCRVNIYDYYEREDVINLGIASITCDAGEVLPDKDGTYVIPAVEGRIQIRAGVPNYNLSDPIFHIYLEGANDEGITVTQSSLTPLEYTDLPYGNYVLHMQVLDKNGRDVVSDQLFDIRKEARLEELPVVKFLIGVLLMMVAGLTVWRILTGTIIRRQYEQIRLAKDEADRANGAKSRFLANMSHEIRTPINTIMGMDEMILREDHKGVPKEYHTAVSGYALDIKQAAETLLSLVNDVLDLSKIESGKMNLVPVDYDIEDMLRSLCTMIRVRAEQKRLSFKVHVDEKIPRTLNGDAGKIKQIVLNLLTNAVKYTQKGGFDLNVLMEPVDDKNCRLIFKVKDTGMGIKAEDMDKLFSAFERLDEEKNSAIQGTGLGLDISRQFTRLMGGDLKCESVYGEGSEFTLTVVQQIVDSEPVGIFDENKRVDENGPYIPKFCAPDAEILVVDDNPMNLNVIKGLLAATKMFISTASSGEECLEKIRYGSYNVVLLDHMMPGMDGVETVKRIREDHPDLPVYALTANITAGEDFYREAGFNGYLSKPVDSTALELAIMKHLPPQIMMKPSADKMAVMNQELPKELSWLWDVEGLDCKTGIRYSGGVDPFIKTVKMFYGSIDETADVLKRAYKQDDLKLYTIKVHALKSSARIIGATKLSELCQKMEDAGNNEDRDFIRDNLEDLMDMYLSYKKKLAGLDAPAQDDDKMEEIPADELAEAYEALKEVIPQMDYEAVEMIVKQVEGYRLPYKDKEFFDRLDALLKKVDWDKMEELIDHE